MSEHLIPTHPREPLTTEYQPDRENAKTASYSFELRPRVLTVTAVARLSPTMVRVRFCADDGFEGFPAIAPEDHLKLFFDIDEHGAPLLPPLRDGRWSARGLTYRDYTVRWYDRDTRSIDIDFVLHDHGVAGRWAAAAAPGQRLGALGPRGAFLIKDVFPWYVLAADETALPALARWVECLRPGAPVTAYIEIQDATSRIALPTRADLTVHWLERGRIDVGTSAVLADAVMAHPFPDRAGFVWVAGESISIKPVRRWIRDHLNLERDNWDVDGYWRRGSVNHDHHHDDETPE